VFRGDGVLSPFNRFRFYPGGKLMSHRLQLSIACLVAAGAVVSAPLRAEDVKDLKPGAKIVMNHGPIAHNPHRHLVIRSAEELVANSSKPLKSKDREVQKEMSSALAQLFKVDAVDWDKQMVVGITTGGGRGDAGSLAFVSFLIQGRTLTVQYTGPGFPDHNCASNTGLALVDRFDCAVTFACANAPNAAAAEDTRELKIIAAAQDSPRASGIGPVRLNDYGGVAIRSAEELVLLSSKAKSAKVPAVQKEIEADLAKLLDVDAIDWSKQMVLAVRGEPGTKADRVRFDSLKIEDKVLTVAWKVIPRPPHAGPGTPIALILVERFDGEVKFAP
jgi:phosphoribosyl-dephospho-CoA transferase